MVEVPWGPLLNTIGLILTIIVLVLSGKAANGITTLRKGLATLRKSVGEPNDMEKTPRTGATLVQKVETMQRDQEHLVRTVGEILVEFQRQQRDFFTEISDRLPPTGKRAERDEH